MLVTLFIMVVGRIRRLSSVLMLAIILAGCSGQGEMTLLPTIPLTFQPIANPSVQDLDAALTAAVPTPTLDVNFYQNDALKAHRIAYLIAPDTVHRDYVLSPEGLEAGFGAVIIHDWPTLLQENAKEPFEAVIIHKSALPFVDASWVTTAYRSAVVIALIDIYYPELPTLLGFCNLIPPSDPWYPRNFFRIYSISYGPVTPQGYERIQKALAECIPFSEIGVSGGRSAAGDTLEGPYAYRFFTHGLLTGLSEDVERPVHIIRTSVPDTTPTP